MTTSPPNTGGGPRPSSVVLRTAIYAVPSSSDPEVVSFVANTHTTYTERDGVTKESSFALGATSLSLSLRDAAMQLLTTAAFVDAYGRWPEPGEVTVELSNA